MKSKICCGCKSELAIDAFPRKSRPGGVSSRCTFCTRMASRDRHLKFRYGIADEEYFRMFENQKGLCAVCALPEKRINVVTRELRRLCIDHDHVTGVVRKLLCHDCNFGIRQFDDDPKRLRVAANYIESFREQPEKE